jgi:hypothetical protein
MREPFSASYRWPLAVILALIAISMIAFAPRLIDYLAAQTITH